MRRYIAGVRYEMLIRDFSYQNRYTLAEDVSVQTVIELKEQSFMLGGIDIIEEAIRQYDGKDFIPQVVGRIGAISADEYAELSDKATALTIPRVNGASRALWKALSEVRTEYAPLQEIHQVWWFQTK